MVKSVQAIKRSPELSSRLCQRCQGYMVREYYMDRFDVNCLWGSGWRCVNDGAVVGRVYTLISKRGIPPSPDPLIGMLITAKMDLPCSLWGVCMAHAM